MKNFEKFDQMVKELHAQASVDGVDFLLVASHPTEKEGMVEATAAINGKGSDIGAIMAHLMEDKPDLANIIRYALSRSRRAG